MNITEILKRTWHYVWSYRALWLFGALLALTTVNGFYFWADSTDREAEPWDVTIKLTEDTTIRLPGEGLRIDFTAADGVQVLVRDGNSWVTIADAWNSISEEVDFDLEKVLVVIGVEFLALTLLGLAFRYTSETAMIRMIDSAERTGEKPSLRQGLRLGWSRTALRLFLIDLIIHVPVTVALLAVFLLALSPLLLWASGSTAAGIVGTIVSAGLLLVGTLLVLIVNVALSLVTQVLRRACAVEQVGVLAAIRRGFTVISDHPKQVTSTWIAWIGIRLAWMILSVPVIIALSPLLLLTTIGAVLAGGVPGALVGSFVTLFSQGIMEPLILGTAVALPIFILVMISPILFVGGMVEIVKSSLWTLTYRELRAMKRAAVQPAPRPAVAQA